MAGRIAERIDSRLDLGEGAGGEGTGSEGTGLVACFGVAAYPGGGEVAPALSEVGAALDAALARLPGSGGLDAA